MKDCHTYPVAQKTSRYTLVVPGIKKQYMEKGVRLYLTTDGKVYNADIYDSKLVAPKMDIKKQLYVEGQNKMELVRKEGRGFNLNATLPKFKICTACGDEKELEKFSRAPNSKDGRRTECKMCNSERAKRDSIKRANNISLI